MLQPSCKVIRPTKTYAGKQAFNYFEGISAETTHSTGICMHLMTIPPSGRAKAHKHEAHETAIYVLAGRAGMWFGENMEEHLEVSAGEYLYIPANMPHLPYNASDSEPCTAILARTDPSEQESVVLLPQFDTILAN